MLMIIRWEVGDFANPSNYVENIIMSNINFAMYV